MATIIAFVLGLMIGGVFSAIVLAVLMAGKDDE